MLQGLFYREPENQMNVLAQAREGMPPGEMQRGRGLPTLAGSCMPNPTHLITHPTAVLRRSRGVPAGCSMALDACWHQWLQGKCTARVCPLLWPADRLPVKCLPMATHLQVDKVQMVQCRAIANQSHITPVAPVAERTSYFFNDWSVNSKRVLCFCGTCGLGVWQEWSTVQRAAAGAGCGTSARSACALPPACCSVHPSTQGLLAVAELLVHPLERAVEDAAAGKRLPKRRADPRLEGLPPPMIPDTPDLSTSVCFMLVRPLAAAPAEIGGQGGRQGAVLMLQRSCCLAHAAAQLPAPSPMRVRPSNAIKQEDFKPLVKTASGFVYKPEKPDGENYVRQKWGWSGTGPGA